jgi:fumarate reductase subunit D
VRHKPSPSAYKAARELGENIMPQHSSLGILPSLVLVTLIIALIGSLHRVSHMLEAPRSSVTGTISTAHLR